MLYVNLALTVALLVFCGWAYTRLPSPPKPAGGNPPPPPRRPCTVGEAKELRGKLQTMARQERWKSRNLDGLMALRSQWLAVKASYALHRSRETRFLDDPAVRNLLEDTYLTLLRGRHQNDRCSEQMTEENGGRLRSYVSPVDGTEQTYSVHVPGIYDPAIRWPLIVTMHGHGGYAPFQGHPAPGYSGAISLSPQGRGASDYKDLGEDDVLAAIAEVKRHFNIDPDRIYLTGTSMGGTGAFHLGVHYADQFAAILPIVGNADNQAWTERWGWNREFPGRNHELRSFVQEGHTARAFAQNLRNLPTYIIAGAADTIVPPAHSRNVVQELRRLNIPVEYREYPGVGHGGFSWEMQQAGLAWMLGWTRQRFPRRISWKADLLKHGKAYWTRMEQFEAPMASGLLEAEVLDDTTLRITTANLQQFSIQRPPQLFSPRKTLKVIVDDTPALLLPPDFAPADDTWYTFRKHPATRDWMHAKDVEIPVLAKLRGCEGPVHEAFMTPFVLVVGTGNDAMRDVWQREATQFALSWKERNGGLPRILLDTEVTDDIEMEYNLILFGGRMDNSVAARKVTATPLNDLMNLLAFEMSGGDDTLEQRRAHLNAPDIGAILVYPNVAIAPNRLVVIIQANAPQAAHQVWGRFGNWFNWGVFDTKKYFDFAIYDARSSSPETMLLVGWFGTHWSVKNARYFLGNPTVRNASADQHYPSLAELPADSALAELPLFDLMPAKISLSRGAVGFGRTFFGEPLPNSIGLRAPVVIEYDIKERFSTFSSGVRLLNPRESAICKARKDGEAVQFTVFGDDRKLGEAKVTWKQPEARIEANVTNVRKLRLEARPAGGPAWLHMGSAWMEPKLKR